MNLGFNVVICPPCGEKVGLPTKRGAHKVSLIWPLLPRLKAVLPPQGREMFRGFTLIELLVVVLIIGILAAVAVPQYQKAVLKSRYASMMPIGKAVAEGNEVYYMEHGAYAGLPTDLDVSGQSSKYPDGTQVAMSPTSNTTLSYVLVTNDNVNNARYVVYQKHSPNFAGATMCEAGDDRANELCVALGGQPLPEGMSGNSQGDAYTAYLLTGSYGNNDSFASGSETESNSGTSTIPAREWDGNPPSCTTNSNGNSTCTYAYKAGEELEDIKYLNSSPTWSCSKTGYCYSSTSSSEGSTIYWDRFKEDGEYGTQLQFDENGILFSVYISRNGFATNYDEIGNIKSTTRKEGGSTFYYDKDGYLVQKYENGTMTYYDDRNANTRLTSEEMSELSAYAQPYVGKTRCQIYPELQDCPKGN